MKEKEQKKIKASGTPAKFLATDLLMQVPGKLRRRPQPPRGLGKRQNAPLNVSEASEGSKHAAEDFRGVGNRPDI